MSGGTLVSRNVQGDTFSRGTAIPPTPCQSYNVGGPDPPISYMKNDAMHKNDVMHTVIYAAFCMLPSLDLQACKFF